MRSAIFIIIALPVLTGCFSSLKEKGNTQARDLNIWNGDTSGGRNGIGFLRGPNDDPCTGVEIAPRCVLTAAHCGDMTNGLYAQDTHPTIGAVDYLRVRRTRVNSQVDMQVLWTTKHYCHHEIEGVPLASPAGCPTGPIAQWNAWALSQTLPAVDSTLSIEGYGPADYPAVDSNGNYIPDIPTRRSGLVKVQSAIQNSSGGVPTGGQIISKPANSDGNVICFGDSGGPLHSGGVVYGINTNGWCPLVPNLGQGETISVAVGADPTKDWLTKMKQEFCRPKLRVLSVSFEPALANAHAYVSGLLHDPYNTHWVNPIISCGLNPATYQNMSACTTNMEFGGLLTLGASQLPNGYIFKRWKGFGDVEANCRPCHNSTDQTCDIHVNLVTETEEIDGMKCVAEYYPPPPPPPFPPTNSPPPGGTLVNPCKGLGQDCGSPTAVCCSQLTCRLGPGGSKTCQP